MAGECMRVSCAFVSREMRSTLKNNLLMPMYYWQQPHHFQEEGNRPTGCFRSMPFFAEDCRLPDKSLNCSDFMNGASSPLKS